MTGRGRVEGPAPDTLHDVLAAKARRAQTTTRKDSAAVLVRADHLLAVLADGALRERVVEEMERDGVVTWGDSGHRARFLAATEAPTPEPPHDPYADILHGERSIHAVRAALAATESPDTRALDVADLARAVRGLPTMGFGDTVRRKSVLALLAALPPETGKK